MIAVEYLRNRGKRHVGHLTNQENARVARVRNLLVPLRSYHLFARNAVLFRHRDENPIQRRTHRLGTSEQLGNANPRNVHRDRPAGKKTQCAQLLDRTLNLPDVRA